MGRPSTYSAEEDAIILSTSGLAPAETNRLLVESGHEARTPGSIHARRHYLKKNPDKVDRPTSITALMERREALLAVKDSVTEALDEVTTELNGRLTEYMDETQGAAG